MISILFAKLDSDDEPEQVRQNISNVIEQILHEMMTLIPREAAKYWHKLGAFFNFFYNMVQDGNLRRINFFIKASLINELMKLTGRYNS